MSRWVHFSIPYSAISFPFLPLISADHSWACDIYQTELRGRDLTWPDLILTLLREENADPRHV
jgi:hypothetical protein